VERDADLQYSTPIAPSRISKLTSIQGMKGTRTFPRTPFGGFLLEMRSGEKTSILRDSNWESDAFTAHGETCKRQPSWSQDGSQNAFPAPSARIDGQRVGSPSGGGTERVLQDVKKKDGPSTRNPLPSSLGAPRERVFIGPGTELGKIKASITRTSGEMPLADCFVRRTVGNAIAALPREGKWLAYGPSLWSRSKDACCTAARPGMRSPGTSPVYPAGGNPVRVPHVGPRGRFFLSEGPAIFEWSAQGGAKRVISDPDGGQHVAVWGPGQQPHCDGGSGPHGAPYDSAPARGIVAQPIRPV